MAMSSYPNGFDHGIVIRGMPLQVAHPGKVYFVNNSSVLPDGGIGGSDSNPGTFHKPFSTIDYAIGRCVAGRGDIIMVMPGHAETVSTSGGIALDVSGVALIGMGYGELRPILTYDSSSDATVKMTISGANCTMSNFVHKCNEASQATQILLTAKDVSILDCEFREGSASGLGFITVGAADNDSDRFHIERCKFYSTGSNQDHFIEILFDMIQGRILDCEGTGDCDEGCIAIPAGGNACLDLQIKGGVYRNVQTNIPAITINGTSCTGVIKDVLLVTDTQASALDNGSLATDNVKWSDETDQVSSVDVLVPSDSAANLIGSNDANNAFSSSSVVANRDGSVLERLEHLASLTDVGTIVPLVATITSSNIPNNTQAAGGLLATVTGQMVLERIVLQTDSTGLAGPTNIEISTDNTKGLTGAGAPNVTFAIASLGANKTAVLQDAAAEVLPLYMTTGKKLYIHGDDGAGTGGGTVDVIMWFRRVSADASVV